MYNFYQSIYIYIYIYILHCMMFGATGHSLSVCTHLEENNVLKSTPNHKKSILGMFHIESIC